MVGEFLIGLTGKNGMHILRPNSMAQLCQTQRGYQIDHNGKRFQESPGRLRHLTGGGRVAHVDQFKVEQPAVMISANGGDSILAQQMAAGIDVTRAGRQIAGTNDRFDLLGV